MDIRYTHGHIGPVVANHATRTAANSAAFLLPHLEPSMRLLDVGCGPGSITIDLASHVAEVVGVDAAPVAIEAARRSAGGRENVTFQIADTYQLPFPDDSFDVVCAHQVLQHLGDPVGALSEMRRVLRAGGRVAVRDADYGTMVHSPHDDRIDRWLALYHELTRHHGAEADAGRYLSGWVAAAGFTDAMTSTTTWTYGTPEAVNAWRDLWVSRLTVGRMGQDLLDLGLTDEATRDDLVLGWQEWSEAETPFFAFLHGEVLATAPG
jgi:SAM-dependent methyltransferase